ncbi:lipopolysaccharide biosynthesis protein [bacterium]|nr:lipopolysaccharide biosynthesis protein [bacterium]
MVEVSDTRPSDALAEPDTASAPIRSKTMAAVGWSTINAVGARIISLIVFMILTGLLDKHSLGLLQLGTIVVAFIQAFAVQGFSDALIQREKVTQEHINTAFWLNLLVGGLLTVLTMIFADTIAWMWNEPELGSIIRWLSISFVLYGISSIERTMMLRNLDFSLPSILMLSSDVVGGAIGIGMALAGFGVWALVGQFTATRVSQAVLFTIWTPWRPGRKMSIQAAVDLYSFGIKIMGIRTLDFVNQRLPDILVKAFFGTDALGLYSVASRLLMSLSQSITAVMAPVAFAATSRIQGDPQRVSRGFYSGAEMISVLTAPVFVGMALVAPVALPYLFGEKWSAIVPVAQWLTVTAMVQATTLDLCANVLMGVGRPSRTLLLNVLFSTVQLVGFVATAWAGGGLVEVAASTAVSALLSVPISLWLIGRSVPISLGEYLRRLASPLVASVAMAPVVLPAMNYLRAFHRPEWSVFVPILLGGLVYALVLALIKPDLARQVAGVGMGLVRKLRSVTS